MRDDIIIAHSNIFNYKKNIQIFFNEFCEFVPNLLTIKDKSKYCLEELEYSMTYYLDEGKRPVRSVLALTSKVPISTKYGMGISERKVVVFEMKIKYKDETTEKSKEVMTDDLKCLEERVTLLEKRVQAICDNHSEFRLELIKCLDSMENKTRTVGRIIEQYLKK